MAHSDKRRWFTKWLAAAIGTGLTIPGLLWGAEGTPRPLRVQSAARPAREPDALPPIVTAESLNKQPASAPRTPIKLPPISQWMQEIDPAVKDEKPAKAKPTSKTPVAPQASSAASSGPVDALLGRMRAAAAAIAQERSPQPKTAASSQRPAAAVEPVRFQANIEDKMAMVVKIQTDDDPEAEPIDEMAPIHPTEMETEDEEATPIAQPKATPAPSARRQRTPPAADTGSEVKRSIRNTQSLKLLVKIDPAEDSPETEAKYLLLDDILKRLYPDRDVSVFFVPEDSDAPAGR